MSHSHNESERAHHTAGVPDHEGPERGTGYVFHRTLVLVCEPVLW